MFITSLELKDVKSYKEAKISFERGTNIIAGNNGAGKTTIVEAIGYVLFDHNPYRRKELLLRHGAKDGIVTVTVEAEDEREYQVVRHISRPIYYVYDRALGSKLAEGREEVLPWLTLTLQLGDEEEDLSSLFRNAVGVEQGLMTAPFLGAPEERKRKFTPLLKVEGYKKAAKEGVKLINHIKEMMTRKNERIQWLSGRLQDFKEKQEKEKDMRQLIVQQETSLHVLKEKVGETKKRKQEMDIKKKEIEQKKALKEKEEAILKKMEDERERAKNELEEARKAKVTVEETKEDHERYMKLERMLAALEKQNKRVTGYQREIQELERKISVKNRDLEHIEEGMKEITTAEKEKERLAPFLAKEKELKEELERNVRRVELLERERRALAEKEGELKERTEKLEELEKELRELERVRIEAEKLTMVEREIHENGMKIAGINSQMAQAQEKKKNLSEGVCPFFEEPCPKIGDDLRSFQERIEENIRQLKLELAGHEEERKELHLKKERARTAQHRHHQLLIKKENYEQLQEVIATETLKIGEKKKELEAFEEAKKGVQRVEHHLKELGEEAGCELVSRRWDVLMDKINEKAKLETQKRVAGSEREKQVKEKNETEDKLRQFGDVEKKMEEHKGMLEELKEAYYLYTRHEKSAQQFETRKERSSKIKTDIYERRAVLKNLSIEQAALESSYHEGKHKEIEDEYKKTEERFYTLGSELNTTRERLSEISEELEKLRTQKKEKKELLADLKENETLLHFVEYLREKVLKLIPDSLIRHYLESINREANRIFQELMGDPMTELRWSHDFEITVRDGVDQKYFGQLSGGQQMCAALAVRLALLRSLSSVSIAFFDEPTQNLDFERRENLAASIRNIRGFHQLFIISHDETFHDLVENTVYLKNEGGETLVHGSMV